MGILLRELVGVLLGASVLFASARDPARSSPAIDHASAREAAEVHWLRGEILAASDAFEAARANDSGLAPTVSEIEAHAYAGKLRLAASLTEELRDRDEARSASRAKLRLSCVAAALRGRAGDAAAAARLAADAGREASCDTLAREASHRGIRRYDVDPVSHGFEPFDPWRRFAERKLSPDYVDWLLDHHDDTAWIRDVPLAHEAAALASRPRGTLLGLDEARTYAIYAARLATFHAQMGEPAEALATLAAPLTEFEAALARLPAARESDVLDGMVLFAAAHAALDAGDDAWAEALLRFVDEHVARHEYLVGYRDALRNAIAGARRHDGPPRESRWLEACASCGLGALAEAVGRQREVVRARGDARLDAQLRPIALRVSMLLAGGDGGDGEMRAILHALETP